MEEYGAAADEELVNVALFIPSLANPGGAERVVVNLSKGLDARGLDVEIVTGEVDGAFTDDIPSTVATRRFRWPRVPVAPVVGTLPGLVRYLNDRRPDCLISFMNQVNLVAVIARELASTDPTLVVTDHNNPELLVDERNPYYRKDRLIYRLAPPLYSRADHIVGVSDGVSDSLAAITGLPRERITTIFNPVVDDRLRERQREPVGHPWLEDDELQVVLGAKPEAQKNLSMLVRAFSRLEGTKNRLVIVGTGEQTAELERVAAELGVADRVDVHGFVENIYAYLSTADVFALSSNWEGLPTILIEALACGCPVVSTDCPSGPREILQDGELGELVPVGDARALGEAIQRTLEADVDESRLRRRAEDFTVEAAAARYHDLIGS